MTRSPIKSSEGPPSEGGAGTVEEETRLHGVLEAVLHLRTFGRWAVNAGNRLTFGRWNRYCGKENAAARGSGGSAASTHLRKVSRKCGKSPHLWKVEQVLWKGKRGCTVFWRQCCIYAPSEGGLEMRKIASPLEGGTGTVERKTRLHGVLGQCCIYAPSEGEQEMREIVSPSEGE